MRTDDSLQQRNAGEQSAWCTLRIHVGWLAQPVGVAMVFHTAGIRRRFARTGAVESHALGDSHNRVDQQVPVRRPASTQTSAPQATTSYLTERRTIMADKNEQVAFTITVEVKESELRDALKLAIANEIKYAVARLVGDSVKARVRDWGTFRFTADSDERGVIEEMADQVWQFIKDDAGFLGGSGRQPAFTRSDLDGPQKK